MPDYFTPSGRQVHPDNVLFTEENQPYTYEWFDGVLDLREVEAEAEEDKALQVAGALDINFRKVELTEQAELALSASEDDVEEVNRLRPVKGVWRSMVLREFNVGSQPWIECKCKKFVANISKKTGLPLKSGKNVVDKMCPLCAGKGKFKAGEVDWFAAKRWARLKPFKASKDQLIRYMQWRGHKVPQNHKTHKPTTAAKELDRLTKKTKDKLYENVLIRRAIDKVDGTYCLGFVPWDDGRIHSEFSYGPASGQLNSFRPNCFSDDTEVLTDYGWLAWPNVTTDDKLAQYDLQTGAIDFGFPTGYVRQRLDGTILQIETDQQINLRVTDEHNCWLRNRKTKKLMAHLASEYPYDMHQLNAGNYVGGSVRRTAAQIALIAALQADGSVFRPVVDKKGRSRGDGGHIEWTFKKTRKIGRLRWALNAQAVPFTEHSRNGRTRFYVSRDDVPEWLKGKKFFGPWLLSFDKTSLRCLAEEVWFWDGAALRRSMYSSSIKTNADWVQILCALTGRRARLRSYANKNPNAKLNWQVDAVDRDYSLTTNHTKTRIPYSGFVYCVSMPNGTVIVRRNNVVAITGQSQNLPKHIRYERLKPLDLPKRFRRLIRARPGHKIWEFDFKSFHILTLGFNAKDAEYMRLARLDMHSHFSSVLLAARGVIKEPIDKRMSDSDLLASLKAMKASSYLMLNGVWQRATKDHERAYAKLGKKGDVISWSVPSGQSIIVKELRDQQAKPAILGKGLCMSAYRLYMENIEYFSGRGVAENVMNAYDAEWPKIIAYQKRIALQAHNDKYLVSKHGFIRRFWDVFHFLYYPDGREEAKRGDDYEASVAFHVQNDAFGHIRDAMVVLNKEGVVVPDKAAPPKALIMPWDLPVTPTQTFTSWNDLAQLINTVHDSLVFEMPNELDNVAPFAIREIMQRKSSILVDPDVAPDGLWCEVEVSCGPNWADLEEVKI